MKIQVSLTDCTILNIPAELDGTRLVFVLWEKTQNYPIARLYSDPLVAGTNYTFNGTFPVTSIEEGAALNVGISNEIGQVLPIIIQDLDIGDPGSQGLSQLRFTPLSMPYMEARPLVVSSCAPDMSLMDLMNGMMNDQCLVFETIMNNRTINIWYEKEYMRRPSQHTAFRDWTGRMDHTVAPAQLRIETPSIIQFRFKADENDRELISRNNIIGSIGFGNANFDVEGYGEIRTISLPFAPTGTVRVLDGLAVPGMRKLGGDFQVDSYQFQPRFLVADHTISGQWKHANETLDVYPQCYFSLSDHRSVSVAFDNASVYFDAKAGTVPTLWHDRLTRMRDSRILEADLFIHDEEIQDFDHGMPTLVDDGSGPAWYYVQEIKQHRFGSGGPTRCTLVQIQGKEVALQDVSNPPVHFPDIPVLLDRGDYNDDFSNDFNNA
ncbi:MAG: hypothetical protein QM724_09605 [Flavobacteriales bacterium]